MSASCVHHITRDDLCPTRPCTPNKVTVAQCVFKTSATPSSRDAIEGSKCFSGGRRATPGKYRCGKKKPLARSCERRDGAAAAKEEKTSATSFCALPPEAFVFFFFLFWFNATHNPDLQADPEGAPDACSRPEMTLPARMTPFIQYDLSPPTRVDA